MPKTNLPSITVVIRDFPQLTLRESEDFYYSSRDKCVYYNKAHTQTEAGLFQLFHEIGHALSSHHHYDSGIQLLKMEAEAWKEAKAIAQTYKLTIPDDLIEHCLNSYRDWLHLRSTCPTCKNIAIEEKLNCYHCFNCYQKWSVPTDQRSRSYRHKVVRSVK